MMCNLPGSICGTSLLTYVFVLVTYMVGILSISFFLTCRTGGRPENWASSPGSPLGVPDYFVHCIHKREPSWHSDCFTSEP